MGAVVAIVGIITVICVLWLAWAATTSHLVFRFPHSFYPSVLRVASGDTVLFVNMSTRPIWPAAGPHPTHDTYPAFDPQRGIPPAHTWAFTFANHGTFAFHDHYSPSHTAIVVVGPHDGSIIEDEDACRKHADTLQQAGCMEIYFREAAQTLSFVQARDIFSRIAVAYPNSCHTFAHDLGKSAYAESQTSEFPTIGEEASACGYGLWHGFTTALQADRGIAASKDFCASLSGTTEEVARANQRNCYHGIGIGLIPDPPPPERWGDFHALTIPALEFCDTINGDPSFRDRCISGVFHALSVYMESKQYGFVFDEHSLSLCKEQAEVHQHTCFSTLTAAVPSLTNFDLEKTVELLRASVPPHLFAEIFKGAAVIFVDADAPIERIDDVVRSCGAIDETFRPLCIWAVMNKLYNNGEPGNEYKKAIAFCESTAVRTSEKPACFHQVVANATSVYTAEKLSAVCKSIPPSYRTNITSCEVL